MEAEEGHGALDLWRLTKDRWLSWLALSSGLIQTGAIQFENDLHISTDISENACMVHVNNVSSFVHVLISIISNDIIDSI